MTDSAGEIGSQTAINDKGVVVSGYAGGGVDVIVRPGLEWPVGVWFEANYSYNENNEYDPNHPMSQHGSATQTTTSPFGLTSSGMRHTTLMKLIKDNYGDIDVEMVQEWRKGHYFYDLDGIRHDTVWVDGYGDVPSHLAPGVATICRHRYADPGVDAFTGINIYVSIAVPEDLAVYRTKGRPCEWVGPWDAVSLKKGKKK